MTDGNKVKRFEKVALSHIDAAYNLARWLTKNDHDAQDIAQEAYLRAFRFFDSFNGEDGRAWLLTIVRNTYFTWRQKTATVRKTNRMRRNRMGAMTAILPLSMAHR